MSLKGKLHQSRLVFRTALYNKNIIHNTTNVILKYLATVQVFSYNNNRNQHYNMYEYAVNKHACQIDVTLHGVHKYFQKIASYS